MKRTVISSCKQYRYVLWRCWDEKLPTLNFVMQNPSTADASQDDPTIRRCRGFARDNGYGSIRVLNVFAFRATVESELYGVRDPVGPENDTYLERQARYPEPIVLAWGNAIDRWAVRRPDLANRYEQVRRILCEAKGPQHLKCLGTTKSGEPKHPLYLARTTKIVEFLPREASGVAPGARSDPYLALVGEMLTCAAGIKPPA